MEPLVQMTSISKSFGGIAALESVDFQLLPGTVHALMGENGAGKSTLMKILAGVVQPDDGMIRKAGRTVHFASPREALDAGISTVFQEHSLLANLSIAENMYLGKEPLTVLGSVDVARMERNARDTLRGLGLNLDPATLVGNLSIAERQFVEIARGISANADVIILDEPSAALNAADVEILNAQIRALKQQDKSVVYISHRMEEIFKICDTISVLKDGRNVDTVPVTAITPKGLIAMMVGRELAELFPPKPARTEGDVVLSIEGLRLTPESAACSILLRRGEIVALAGLEGQGQRELVRSLVGRYAAHEGRVRIGSRELALPLPEDHGIRMLQALGVSFVPEDRKLEGLFLDLSLAHNLTIGLHSQHFELAPAGSHRHVIANSIKSLSIKAATPYTPVGTLSGGNQQKVLLGRYLALGADILLIEEPTRGVDVGAKAEIYKLLRAYANAGGSVVVLSRETLELIGLCDRLYVIHDKHVVAEMPAEQATEHAILEAALHR
ncbi:sugar ABC transporter ATP-binding protein [Bradyrhizobium manausense]|uniref:sugar ABC transporter ATP-binding protein n=1 Tax=Bradyrhizobium manausense TaxID=989370 RepID=UPI001BAB4002|nr:sugar ABC transporter ATP-binding protein [Bradyrhizobium manausense]MBR0830432.1 sugar ABC transporter ATP-binding protein [Bradyrhizobium manausense]